MNYFVRMPDGSDKEVGSREAMEQLRRETYYPQIIDRLELVYSILRRAILNRMQNKRAKPYSREELEKICTEIEGKNVDELKEIHKKWIGY